MKVEVYWEAFWAWVVVGILGLVLLADELMGIAHVWGLNPITTDTVTAMQHGDYRLFFLILGMGVDFAVWWIVHIKSNGGFVRVFMLRFVPR